MKNLLWFIGILLSQNLLSQKIDETNFNTKDSIFTVKTTVENVGNRLISESGDIKPLKTCAVYSKSVIPAFSNTAFEPMLYFFFVPDRIASVTGGVSSVKVKFTDGEVVEHKHEGSNKLFGTNQSAAIYFTVFTTDKLFTTPIQSVKVVVSSGEFEYSVESKRKDLIKNSLQLLLKESKKL